MKVFKENSNLIFDGVCDFDLVQILESGQFFRFREDGDAFIINA